MKAARNLATMLAARGKLVEAESLIVAALRATERDLGPDHAETGTVLYELGSLKSSAGQLAEAEAALRRAAMIREAAGAPAPLAEALDALGAVFQGQWRLGEAEAAHRRAASLVAVARGEGYGRATYLNNLAVAVEAQGRLAEAEELYKSVLEQWARVAGTESDNYAVALNNLARVEHQLERFEETAALLGRATSSIEKRGRTSHPDYCAMLSNLALGELELGRLEPARRLSERAITTCEQRLGPRHIDLVEPLNTLGRIATTQSDVVVATEAFGRALDLVAGTNGPLHPTTAFPLHNLAGVLLAAGDTGSALELLVRASASAERARGGLDVLHATTLEVLALAHFKLNRTGEALASMRHASSLTRARLARALPGRGAGPSSSWADLRKRFAFHAALAVEAAARAPSTEAAELENEGFVFAELARGSSAAHAIAQMATRFAAATGALAELVRERQDKSEQLREVELQLQQINTLGRLGADSPVALSLRLARASATARIAAIDRRLEVEFPEYVELANPEPPGVAEARSLLLKGEALLGFLVREEETLIWFLDAGSLVVRREHVGRPVLAELVARLRRSPRAQSRRQIEAA